MATHSKTTQVRSGNQVAGMLGSIASSSQMQTGGMPVQHQQRPVQSSLRPSSTPSNQPSTSQVSMFDNSVENHFIAMDTIFKICGEAEDGEEGTYESEIQRLSSSVTFLQEWRHYLYEPKTIKFAGAWKNFGGKNVGEVKLPQFSSASVPKEAASSGGTTSPDFRDFIMYVGGPVWALDWCPRVHERTDCHVKCEYIAVSAHPPGSSYHIMGEPLTGRGVIQIWCLLNVLEREEELSTKVDKHTRQCKNEASLNKSALPKRPRGRPRKKQEEESLVELGTSNRCAETLTIQYPHNSSQLVSMNGHVNDEDFSIEVENHTPQCKDGASSLNKLAIPKRPRGRPRKKQKDESLDILRFSDQCVETLAIQYTDDISHLVARTDNVNEEMCTEVEKHTQKCKKVTSSSNKLALPERSRGRPRKKRENEYLDTLGSSDQCIETLTIQHPMNNSDKSLFYGKESSNNSELCPQRRRKLESKRNIKISPDDRGSCVTNLQTHSSFQEDNVTSGNVSTSGAMETISANHSVTNDVALPRVALCLAHNGKVVWDVKWKPYDPSSSKYRLTMGYLAVLLGNGSLEVWEVPLPRTMKAIHSSLHGEGNNFLIDPRFVKLEPVFRCSILRSGASQSIPMSVDWSSLPPHDYLVVGCHDGTVALWKFFSNSCCKDTNPILRFSADTVPIRGVSFAPNASDQESANVILTAGHRGIKFWDLRDPFRPLWDLHQVPRMVYSLDWLPHPRCVMLSFDDGTMRLLSLSRAASDVPATGKPFNGTKQQGLNSYFCSTLAIWSVHVSRLTGMVAYCGADGTINRFQLTTKAVESDHSRNKTPHFLCGSITEEDSTITINTPLPNTPSQMKKPSNKCGNKPVALRDVLAKSNQAKRENSKTADRLGEELPVLCYGEDPAIQSGSEDSFECLQGGEKTSKPRTDKAKKSQPVVKENEELERENKYEVLPPKTVALHRVRWNMNKGSERWLCYGGAAGILRCQEIVFSDIDKKLMRKQ